MTLLFSLVQAAACGEAKVQLISPFVGRITDWHKAKLGANWNNELNSGQNDPGVMSVKRIFNYYKFFNIPTEIMGASFRNINQIIELAGCDLLTISPELLEELQGSRISVTKKLGVINQSLNTTPDETLNQLQLNEPNFRLQLNDDAMASEKLSEGIRNFCIDTQKLESLLLN